MFITNTWYVAAYSDEVTSQPLARKICGENVLLYRKADGAVVSLHDECPHRLVALSLGFVEGDDIRCKYHGMLFGPDGRCVGGPTARSSMALRVRRTYPVGESQGLIWVWLGSDAADLSAIPHFEGLNGAWALIKGRYDVACDHRLIIDNLMDLTHETYVHPETIGQVEIQEPKIIVTKSPTSAAVERHMSDIEPSPYWKAMLNRPGKVDRWQICQFSMPANVVIDSGVAVAGTGGAIGSRSEGITSHIINLITPSTNTTSYYFIIQARNFAMDCDEAMTARFREIMDLVIGQDKQMLESQQLRMNESKSKLAVLDIDAAASHARLLIQRAIKAEQSGGRSQAREMAHINTT